MRLAEKLLLFLSREPKRAYGEDEENNVDTALSLLCRVFPNFIDMIQGKQIVDFGCGVGNQTTALARGGAKHVLGLDSNLRGLKKSAALALVYSVQDKVAFTDRITEDHKGKFDIVISQNSMEHFNDPVEIMAQMKSMVTPEGRILVSFGPPWFAPYGSHMYFFTKVPWVNIFFSEKTVMKVRSYFRNDGATKYEDVESGLNKMTVARFEQIINASGLDIVYQKYECVRDMDILSSLPIIRELFINHVSYVLKRSS